MIYIAYGSNMDINQMAYRCPGAEVLGKAMLNNWRLLYRTSASGAYATIERAQGYKTPCLLWYIDKYDEKSLDRYEGFPRYYQKVFIKVNSYTTLDNKRVSFTKMKDGLIYVLPTTKDAGLPPARYYLKIKQAYLKLGFDPFILKNSLYNTYKILDVHAG